MKQTHC